MRGKATNPKDLRIVFWSLAIGLIMLVIVLFLIPAMMGGSTNSGPAQETARAIYATETVVQRLIGALEAAWTATANASPVPDE